MAKPTQTLKRITVEDDLDSWIPIKAITDEEKIRMHSKRLVANDDGTFLVQKTSLIFSSFLEVVLVGK